MRWSPKIGQCVKVDSRTLLKEDHPMSTTRRRRYSAEFKAKVALEAIRGEQIKAEPKGDVAC